MMTAFKFNPDNIEPLTRVVNTRQECTTFESALSYIQDRVAEMRAENVWPWIEKHTGEDGKEHLYVVVTLKNMPVYWSKQTTGKKVTIYNPDGTVREKRSQLVNTSRYKVQSKKAGIEMLEALASGEHEELNERIRYAANAYSDVVNVELPAINEKAEMLFRKDGYEEKYGPWAEGDEEGKRGMRISQGKTYAMNTCKQKARRQLGYGRYYETLKIPKT